MRKYGARSDHTKESHFDEDFFVFNFSSYFLKPQKKNARALILVSSYSFGFLLSPL